jgi:hypothetical protein
MRDGNGGEEVKRMIRSPTWVYEVGPLTSGPSAHSHPAPFEPLLSPRNNKPNPGGTAKFGTTVNSTLVLFPNVTG